MQSAQTIIQRVPRQLYRNIHNMSTRRLVNMPTAMSFVPRFTSDFSPMFKMFDEYDQNMFSSFNRQLEQVQHFAPKFDIKETNEGYELQGELPGLEHKDINIEWTDSNTLTVSGRHETIKKTGGSPQVVEGAQTSTPKQVEHQATVEDEPAESSSVTETQAVKQPKQSNVTTHGSVPWEKHWTSERTVGSFHRSFAFPTRVDQDAVKASLKNGILSILVPRQVETPARKVQIE